MEPVAPERADVFISYSHKDKTWLDRVLVHLKPLQRDRGVTVWSDLKIQSGSQWRRDIQQALQTAKVAVLLISADFLYSDFIANNELPYLLKAAEGKGVVILPVIISPSRFESTNLSEFQAVNRPTQPLRGISFAKREQILVDLSIRIEGILCDKVETSSDYSDHTSEILSRFIPPDNSQSHPIEQCRRESEVKDVISNLLDRASSPIIEGFISRDQDLEDAKTTFRILERIHLTYLASFRDFREQITNRQITIDEILMIIREELIFTEHNRSKLRMFSRLKINRTHAEYYNLIMGYLTQVDSHTSLDQEILFSQRWLEGLLNQFIQIKQSYKREDREAALVNSIDSTVVELQRLYSTICEEYMKITGEIV